MCLESIFTTFWSYDTNVTNPSYYIWERHHRFNNVICVQVTMITERIRIFESLCMKRITCKTCKNALFRTSDEVVILRVPAPDLQSHIFRVMCTSCTNKRRGQIFICISCGRINSRSAKNDKTERV